MVRWGGLADERPDLAAAGRALLYQFGIGLAYLSTVRRDGGPRVHPMCPLLTGDGLYAFLEPSPKRDDLLRDPRYALHSFSSPENDDAFYVTGTAGVVEGADAWAALSGQFVAERGGEVPRPDRSIQLLFELTLDRCLHTTTTGHGDWHPRHTVWRSPARS